MKDKRKHDDTKLLWHMDRVMKHFDKGERVAPIHIDFGIAKYCNISCCYCYGFFQDVKPVHIAENALILAVEDAAEIGVKSIAFIGDGEPTMNPALYRALDVGMRSGLDMALSTNGVRVDDLAKCETILRSCRWMRFCISAGTRDGYKKIHGRDYFDKVVDNVRRMVDVKKSLGLECEIGLQSVFVPTLMREEMIAEAKLAVDLGVDYFVIKQCSLPDAGESGMVTFDLKEYDSEATNEALRRCEAMSTDKTDIIVKWNIMKQKGERPYTGCPSVPFISEISGDGSWYPCGHMFGDKPQFSDYKFGNIHDMRLRDIFNSDRYHEIISKMRKDFDVRTQCKGACRLDKTNEFCWNYLNRPSGINFI